MKHSTGTCTHSSTCAKLFVITIFLLSTVAFSISPVEGEGSKLLRMLEARIMLNSTVLVRISSTPGFYQWQYFKNSFYDANKSYWHSYVVDRIAEAFGLSDYRVLRAEEDETSYAFVVELTFQLNGSGRYVEQNGTLTILDSFKPNGEYFSSIKIESERNIYDCSPRNRVLPRIWYSTQKIEWRNTDYSDAPREYRICFKIPLRIVSNLPSDVTWRIYLNSKLVASTSGNVSLIYVDEADEVSVERVVKGQEGVRYFCGFPSLPAALEANRTLSFNYTKEYRVSLNSTIRVETVIVNSYGHSIPYEFWVTENTSLTVSVIPIMIEGSFTNHVFDGWVDNDGTRLGVNFTVTRPMMLTAVWREELNLTNTTIVVSALIFAFLIPELRKRVSVEVVWKKPGYQAQEEWGE